MKTSPRKSGLLARSCLALLALTGFTHTGFGQAFVHPGCLETAPDFARMQTKVSASQSPWIDGWNKLLANSHASSSYTLQGPVAIVYRGTGYPENYGKLYNDIAACYQNSLRWKINGDTACANKAVQIMNAWSSTLTSIQGSSDRFLASGLYGYEFACAAENMRDYSGLSAADFTAFQNMLRNIFYPMCHDFLVNHNGACISHYWANWDLCNIAAVMAFGVVCDDRTFYNEALNYWKTGAGNGAIGNAVPFTYNNGALGQGQEEGRDQGHAGLNVSLQGAICQIAFNQGDDLFAWSNNRVLAMSEYFADYNLGNSVPYTTYNNCDNVNQTVISSGSQGDNRPCWDLIYNHYANRKGVATTYSSQYALRVRPEGGGGDFGPNSGGYDQLGFGTLTCTIDYRPIANGTYRLLNRADGKYLDNLGATTDGANVGQWASSSSNNQKWTLTYQSNGYYKLACVTAGKCLDNMGRTADGANIGQWGSGGSWNQQWMVVPVGSYYKLVNRSSGKCLDTGGLSANGSIMQQWYSNGSSNQQWSFTN